MKKIAIVILSAMMIASCGKGTQTQTNSDSTSTNVDSCSTNLDSCSLDSNGVILIVDSVN